MTRKSTRRPARGAPRSAARASLRGRAIDAAALCWATARRGAAALAWLALVAGAATAWLFGLPRLAAYAQVPDGSHQPEVHFREVPPWLDPVELERLQLIVSESLDGSPLDRGDLEDSRESLLATGWFESVSQVRRSALDRVEVVATFAAPAALVRADGRDHLVDRHGRLLPRSWPAGEGPALGVVSGARQAAPVAAGEAWGGADVAAGLATLALVDAQPWATQVALVDLSGFGRTRTVRLVTDRGTVLRWGRAPGDEHPAEVAAEIKLRYLDHQYQHYGHVDGGVARDGQEIDLTSDVVVVRPAA